jgi:hypothetical protein
MDRSSTTPLVVGIVFCATVAVLTLWIVASLEFDQWEIRHGYASLPALSGWFRSVYKMGFCLPIGFAAFGAFFIGGRHRPLSLVTWYLSIAIMLTASWVIFGIFSLYCMYAKTGHLL